MAATKLDAKVIAKLAKAKAPAVKSQKLGAVDESNRAEFLTKVMEQYPGVTVDDSRPGIVAYCELPGQKGNIQVWGTKAGLTGAFMGMDTAGFANL